MVHVVILGCGRVGSAVARTLERSGHSVAIIDQNPDAFRRLNSTKFAGQRVIGVGFDRDTLIEAGIERAASFAAVSSGDNSNIIAARVARETFGVETVVARIYDPRRAAVYERLGIPTVATVRWTADQMVRRLVPDLSRPEWIDPGGTIAMAELSAGPGWVGHPLRELEEAQHVRVVCVTRLGEGLIPVRETVVQDGDVLHVVVEKSRLGNVQDDLSAGGGGRR